MFKALLSKQMRELLYGMFRSKKKDKTIGTGAIVLYIFLLVFVFASLGAAFFGISALFGDSLIGGESEWCYFALVGMLAFCLGILGSVFMTYSGLYEAKDNELLLSLPIKPSLILFVRLISIYLMAFLFEFPALIPCALMYFIFGGFKISVLLGILSSVIVLPLFTVAISCILGWVIALLASRIKSKSIITVLLTLTFLTIYYVFIFNSDKYLEMLVSDPGKVEAFFSTYMIPFMFFGKACAGSALYFALYLLGFLLVFGIVYAVLSRSFIKLTTTKLAAKKTVYEKKGMKTSSPLYALYKKEFSHLLHSAAYMMNCALGSFFCIIVAVAMLIKGWGIAGQMTEGLGEFAFLIPVIGVAGVCMLSALNDISVPSVSLEGKTLWISNSLPIKTETILLSKILLHFIITAVPVSLFAVAFDIVFRPDIYSAVFIVLIGIAFSAFCAVTGMWLGILHPNLEWTNETIAVKSGVEILLALLLNLISGLIISGLGVLLVLFVSVYVAFPVIFVLLAGISYVVWCWVKTSGAKRFSSL